MGASPATRGTARSVLSARTARLLPLPERLLQAEQLRCADSQSMRRGPRDPETGFPIGGAGALVNSTELRLPPPPLPYLGRYR